VIRRSLLLVVVALAAAACGGGDDGPTIAPAAVEAALAPDEVGDGLRLHPNETEETLTAFANAGERSLVADGRIWEIRRADRLVGTLQISTVLPDVDLSKPELKDALVRQIIPGSLTSIRIGSTEVFTAVVDEKAVFVWFGKGLYEVLQLKDRTIEDFEAIATDVIEHQETLPAWEPLPELLGTDED
jgi:hypothetical protein